MGKSLPMSYADMLDAQADTIGESAELIQASIRRVTLSLRDTSRFHGENNDPKRIGVEIDSLRRMVSAVEIVLADMESRRVSAGSDWRIERWEYNSILKCGLFESEESHDPHFGETIRIRLAEGQECDMQGAIAFGKSIVSKVKSIFVYSGVQKVAHYTLKEDGTWKNIL